MLQHKISNISRRVKRLLVSLISETWLGNLSSNTSKGESLIISSWHIISRDGDRVYINHQFHALISCTLVATS